MLIVGPDNRLQRRKVQVAGARSEGLLVGDGLAGNERVVAIAGAFLRVGEAVAVAAPARHAAQTQCRDGRRAQHGERAMRRMSAWAITHPVFPLVLFAVLTVFGIVAFVRLPITLNPDISAPFVHVTISEPGAAPAEIETQILQKVEGCGRQHRQRQEHHLARHRGCGADHHRIPDRHAGRSRHHRRARCGGTGARANCRRESWSRRCGARTSTAARWSYYAVSTTGMSEEQLSWFVDDTISKRLLAVPGVAQVSRAPAA